jgi:hypothetical protein
MAIRFWTPIWSEIMPRPAMDRCLGTRVRAHEAELFEAVAASRGERVSEFLRGIVRDALRVEMDRLAETAGGVSEGPGA